MSGRNANRAAIITATLGLLFLLHPAVAQEEPDVYGPPAPENAGFVRIANARAGSQSTAVRIGSRSFDSLGFAEVGPYRPVRAGIYLVRAAGAESEVVVRADSYATVVLGSEGIAVIRDQRHDDPARAQLVMYNLASSESVDLVVRPDGPTVLESVGGGQARSIAVNAVPVTLSVRAGERVVGRLDEIRLTRGDSFGVFLFPGPSGPVTAVHKARVVTEG